MTDHPHESMPFDRSEATGLDPHDHDRADAPTGRPDADVVALDAVRRARRTGDTPNLTADDTDASAEDHEAVTVGRAALGGPVDPADEVPASVAKRARRRAPIVPAWMRTRAGIQATIRQQIKDAGYVLGYHAVRSPKYLAKTAVYAPVGLFSTLNRVMVWATAERGNWELRQAAANRNDARTWLELDKRRQRQSRWRWSLLSAVAAAGGVGGLAVYVFDLAAQVPTWAYVGAATVAAVAFARIGRPADKPITDRVHHGTRYRKLTADLVRRALVSANIPGLNQAVSKDPGAITFPQEIHRDGPGHLAVVDLPYGVEAAEAVARRARLASGMRLPFDQVWPEVGDGHPGRLALWVGYQPASEMKPPTWPLLTGGKVDVFTAFPFVTTPRMDTVDVGLVFRNWLIGGQPGSGKTFALRLLVLAAALDPRVELRGYELKGVGDFKCVEPVCTEYGNGFDDDTKARAAAMIAWLYSECERRAKRIGHYAALGKAPENKVTPELASLKGSGLHPLVVFIDEVQELFQDPTWGKQAGEMCEKVIKLGRALGVILLLGTQIPDKDSLPPGITRNVNTRYCLSVADQVANDMILGTSAYKQGHRATVFQPVDDAGWGILAGFGKPGARRTYNVDTPKAEQVIARAISSRTKTGTLPTPAADTTTDRPAVDVLADVTSVWPGTEPACWNETLCQRLADKRPEVYGGWRSEQLTTALKPHGVTVEQIGRRIDGKPITRRGIRLDNLTAAVAERNRRRGGG